MKTKKKKIPKEVTEKLGHSAALLTIGALHRVLCIKRTITKIRKSKMLTKNLIAVNFLKDSKNTLKFLS